MKQHMKKTPIRIVFALCLLALAAARLDAGTPETLGGGVSGFVTDKETGETLVGATVRLKGTSLGTVTNKSGFYAIAGLGAGTYTMVVSFVGYQKQEMVVTLGDAESKKINVILLPEALRGKEVVVVGNRFETDRQITVSHVNIPAAQIQQIRIGGEADVFRSIQYLPGVLASSQISSGLYIRGGSPDQTLVLLDGSTVYNPSHLFGFFSTFNTDAIKDVDLIKGGYPAEYGGRLSAVLDLVQKDGNQNQIEGLASVGLISSKLSMQGPVGNGSWFIGGRRTYIDALTSMLESAEDPLPDYYFYDANAKISQSLGSSDKVFLSGFAGKDQLDIDNNSGFNGSMGIRNTAAASRWTHVFGENLFSVLNLSWSEYSNSFRTASAGWETRVENGIEDYTLKGNLEWFVTPSFTLKSGFEGTHYLFTYLQNFTGNADSAIAEGTRETGRMNLRADDNTLAAYVQGNMHLTDLLSVQFGLRGNWYELRDIVKLDPRFSLRWQAQYNLALKASWGMYHQYFRLASLPDFSFFDTWLPTDSTVNPSHAVHYVLGVESQPVEGYDLNIDLYYKTMHHLSELNMFATTGRDVADFFYDGRGEAFGIELFLQKKIGRLTGWAGYALGFMNRQFDRINRGAWFRPRWDRRHDVKIVAMYQIDESWDVGATFTFQSGQSYTGMTSRVQSSIPGDDISVGVTMPADRYGLRLPPSHQLNINVNYNTTVFGLPAKILLDIYNVYSRRDIWFRYYNTDGDVTTVEDVRLLPILPSLAIEVKF
ncbi:MAG: TonB-dependent receptor [Ignavibacteriae bacterium]|nr:TonB-dependent receptor [Ignavibacteriota bacterium]